jgi:hypothetical protein
MQKRLAALGPQQLAVAGIRCVATPFIIRPRQQRPVVARTAGRVKWCRMRARRCTSLGSIHASYFPRLVSLQPEAWRTCWAECPYDHAARMPSPPNSSWVARKAASRAAPSCWRATGWRNRVSTAPCSSPRPSRGTTKCASASPATSATAPSACPACKRWKSRAMWPLPWRAQHGAHPGGGGLPHAVADPLDDACGCRRHEFRAKTGSCA